MRPIRALPMLLLALAGAARAAAIDPAASPDALQRQLDELNRRPLPAGEALARAVIAAVQVDAARRHRCRPSRITLGPLAPVTLDGMITGMIVRGQIENGWLVSATLDDCPPADPIRILLLRGVDGTSLNGIFAGQGESLGWPTLLREALRATVGAVVRKLRSADPRCAPRDLTPIGVRIAGRSPDLGPDRYGIRFTGSWSEVWAFEPCGHRIAIPIGFRTDGRGGAYWDIAEDQIVYVK